MKIIIVDENDAVIGSEERSLVHQNNLIYRTINVFFITPTKEIVFQKRAITKETNPGLLGSSVGGHVDVGDTYESAALREIQEETGLIPEESKLIFVRKVRLNNIDQKTKLFHNRFSALFCYPFDGDVSTLQVEKGEADGFEKYSIEYVENHPEKFSPNLTKPEFINLYHQMFSVLYENSSC